MSTTTPAPATGGLTQDEKIIIGVVCGIAGLVIIAILLRCLVPCCRKKKYKKEPDDRSLFQSTQSLSNVENQFFYAGPVVPPRDLIASSKSENQSLPVPHGRAQKHTYVNTATEEFRESTAWVSGFHLSREISQEEELPEQSIHEPTPPADTEERTRDEMRGEYSRQDSSIIHRNPMPLNPVPITSRSTRYETRQEVIRGGIPRPVQIERNVRASPRINRISEETTRDSDYDMPPRFPREVETTQPKLVSREVLLKSAVTKKRPVHYVRSMNTESGVPTQLRTEEAAGQPSWVGHALMMPNPGFISRSLAPPTGSTPTQSLTQNSQYARREPEQLSAEQILRSRPYIEGAPVEPPDSDQLEWQELKRYGHFTQQGPGTRTIYSLGKDAVRTPVLREYVRSGQLRQNIQLQNAVYGNGPPAASDRGDNSSYYAERRGRDYAYTPAQSGGGFVPIDSDSIPTQLPSEMEYQSRETVEANNRLNRELSSYLNNGSSLKALDMSSTYRENWDYQFDPHNHEERALNHHSHPSENRSMMRTEAPGWYQAQQQERYEEMLQQQQRQQLNQNLSKQKKGKKDKGKK